MRIGYLVAALAAIGCTGEVSGVPGSDKGPTPPGGPSPDGTNTPQNVAPDCLDEQPSPRVLRQLTRSEYQQTVSDLLALPNPDITAIPPDREVRGFSNNITVAFVDEQHLDAYSTVAGSLATHAIAEAYGNLVPCATEDDACAASFIDGFGLRAFRRPLTDAEKSRYLGLFAPAITGGQFKTGVELTIRSLLISPSFLFRSELGQDSGQGS